MIGALNDQTGANVILIVTAAVLLLTAVVYGIVLWITRRAAHGDVMMRVMEMIQESASREARRLLYLAERPDTTNNVAYQPPTMRWQVDAETFAAIDHVCQMYNTIGALLHGRFLPRKLFFATGGTTAVRCFDLALPHIENRSEWQEYRLWPQFEWLAKKARKSRHYHAASTRKWEPKIARERHDRLIANADQLRTDHRHYYP